MQKIWIIGGGGFAAECHMFLTERMKIDHSLAFGGFLATHHNLFQYGLEHLYVGHYGTHTFCVEDYVVIAIGNAEARKNLFEQFVQKGIRFYTLTAPSALVSPFARIGKGNIFCANVQISPGVVIGDANLFNSGTIVGHDAKIGNFNVFSAYCAITGYAQIGAQNFFGTCAGMLPRASVGSRCTIGAGSIVYKRVKDDTLAVGNPAMKM